MTLPKDPPEPSEADALKKEIIAEVKKELLKRDVVKALDDERKPAPSFSDRPFFKAAAAFFQHSAVLLTVGFLLTGVIGSALTAAWQSNSWITQQSLLANQRILDQKYELASSVAKAVGDTHAAPTSVLLLFSNEDTPQNRKNELPKRVEYWRQTYRDWLTNNNILLQKITVYVRDDRARKTFQEIINHRKETNNSILNLLLVMEQNKGDKFKFPGKMTVRKEELGCLYEQIKAADEAEKKGDAKADPKQVRQAKDDLVILKITYFAGNALYNLNEAGGKARELMRIMAAEIAEDSVPPSPKGFWAVLAQIFGFGGSPAARVPTPTPTPTPTPPATPTPTCTSTPTPTPTP